MDVAVKPTVKRMKFDVHAYHQLIASGILPPDQKVELIDGEIIEMSPVNSLHAGIVKKISRLFYSNTNSQEIIVSVQDPILLDEYSEPQPDLALLQYRADIYTKSHPSPEEILLLVEVSNSTLDIDKKIKLPLYAQASIPEVWIINLVDEQVEVYSKPKHQIYTQTNIYQAGDIVANTFLPELKVDDIFIP